MQLALAARKDERYYCRAGFDAEARKRQSLEALLAELGSRLVHLFRLLNMGTTSFVMSSMEI